VEFDELTRNGDARRVFATVGEIVQRYTASFPEEGIETSIEVIVLMMQTLYWRQPAGPITCIR
jgi:hypothetical protein